MSELAKKRLVSALVSLAKSTRGGYAGLHGSAMSGGRRRCVRRSGGSLSGGALSGGRKRRTTRRGRGGNLGVTNLISGAGLSGGRKRRTRKSSAKSGNALAEWRDYFANYRARHPRMSFVEARSAASEAWKKSHPK